LAQLPEVYRQVIEWCNHERCAYDEIDRQLERSPEAARKLWTRAINHLMHLHESPDESSPAEYAEPAVGGVGAALPDRHGRGSCCREEVCARGQPLAAVLKASSSLTCDRTSQHCGTP
jgi:hypothetical protein